MCDGKNWHHLNSNEDEIAAAVVTDRQLIQQWIQMHGRKACQ
jgi:uncharacterized heparinase superfamily protein